ncbi:MAG: KTSC domain-containing protein [Anaerolineae bacterium]|uniref:KTSC domain-containing protein n=1 Tax=Promineifilum sp. TaxID=2664178 RepID=UPI001DECD057|nr:KTSC domain-containing protein [Anaerolineales bacterium]MCB8936160.1 KTSC domain-containing protein [Promineifilum sp.]MCO5180284.1 KTSC domain-containing protein [Promineifilum sp.]MCW5846125.1 KTSC domain-containing protein [Anaerolineae bacterium]
MKQLISAIYEKGMLRLLEPVDLAEEQEVRIRILVEDIEDVERKMQRTPVASSLVASVGYVPEYKVLEIEFQDGRSYQYFGVPERIYKGLMAAESRGRYFNERIRDAYVYGRSQ